MTVQTDANKVVYVSDGVETSYAFNFQTYDPDWIQVYDAGVLTARAFDVTINMDQDINPGGSVEYTDPPPANGETITLERIVPFDQNVDYTAYDAFPAETHEGALDKLTLLSQQLDEQVGRAYKAPIDSAPGDDFSFPPYEAGALLGWSSTEENKIDNAPYSFEDIIAEADRANNEADRAGIFANNAQQSELKAAEWAAQDEDIPVEGQLFSAKHYAIKALRSRGGLNLIAIIAGDDTCPKPGDDPGDCIAPDYRNPSERFPDRTDFPGDYFVMSNGGNMNLKDPENPLAPAAPAPVEVNDFVIYLPDVFDGGGAQIVGEGWYRQESLAAGAISAADVSFNDTSTISKGVSVQAFNQALDAAVLRKAGGIIEGLITVIMGGEDSVFAIQSDGTNTAKLALLDEGGNERGALIYDRSNGGVSIQRTTNTGGLQGSMTIGSTGNVSITALVPEAAGNLTRKDYVDGNPTMVRTGDRLDITNVREA